MARILRANLNQPRRDSGIPHESASGAFGINQTLAKFGERYFGGVKPVLDWSRVGREKRKVFYYDAIPVQMAGEDDNAHSARVAPKRQELAQIERQPRYHVRTGEARHRRGRGNEQKMVDVQLAVDSLLMASRGLFQSCTLLTGDLDFKPLVSALVEMGIDVQLLYPKGETNDDLKAAADSANPLTISVCQSWINDISPKPALPHAVFNSAEPRVRIAHLIEWNDDRFGQCYVERQANAFALITERSPQHPLTHRLEMSSPDAVVLRAYAEDVFDLIVPPW
jgi:uncharacterized LabA/DUF88 family protein